MKNNSELKVMFKEAGILFGITLIAGLLLGLVFEVTRQPRALQQQKAVQEACVAVFPNAVNQGIALEFTEISCPVREETANELIGNGVEIGTVFEAKSRDGLYGYVVEAVSTKGYGGKIVLYVGVGTDGTVNGVSITEISETAGLGMEAPNVLTPQFAGKKVESFSFTKNGATKENEVDAISSATITTRAVTNAVNGGLKIALELIGGATNE